LVVVISGEHGFAGTTGGNFNSMAYGEATLTEAVQEGTMMPTLAVFYLDNPGPSADLVVNQANHNSSPYAIYLLSGTAEGVGATGKNYGYDANSFVDLTTTAAGSLVIAGIGNSGPEGGNFPATLTADEPLVSDAHRVGNTRWYTLDTGHATVDSVGTDTYSFSGANETDVLAIGAVEFLSADTSVPGDADEDGDVDAADYIMVKKYFGGAPGAVGTGGDVADGPNGKGQDGVVDWYDLQLLAENYSPAEATGMIPEPATMGLLAFGAFAMIRRRRRS